MADYAAESGHYYERDGTPRYTIVGKNGNERNTTLRDARVHGLVPSVTTIIRQAAAPGLEKWKREQTLLAALTLPRMPDELEADWLKRVEADSRAQGKAAMELGTAIHAAIELAFRWQPMGESLYRAHVLGVIDVVHEFAGNKGFHAERSFASPLGYGGKLDLHSDGWVIDFKTKDFGEDDADDPTIYDEHEMQIAAYRQGIANHGRGAIVFVSTRVPGLARFVEIDKDRLMRGLGMFNSLLDFWYHKTGLAR